MYIHKFSESRGYVGVGHIVSPRAPGLAGRSRLPGVPVQKSVLAILKNRVSSNSRTTKAGGSYLVAMRRPPVSVRL